MTFNNFETDIETEKIPFDREKFLAGEPVQKLFMGEELYNKTPEQIVESIGNDFIDQSVQFSIMAHCKLRAINNFVLDDTPYTGTEEEMEEHIRMTAYKLLESNKTDEDIGMFLSKKFNVFQDDHRDVKDMMNLFQPVIQAEKVRKAILDGNLNKMIEAINKSSDKLSPPEVIFGESISRLIHQEKYDEAIKEIHERIDYKVLDKIIKEHYSPKITPKIQLQNEYQAYHNAIQKAKSP